ncbi:MAG: hypothetical protein QOH93_124, partial [Chloroflexia bacterium]|nr:hypothetical protein [Chloroflexia bacterium]
SVDMPVYEQADGNWLVIPTLPRLSNMNSQEPVTVSLSIVQYDIALAQWTYVPARPTTYKEVVLSRDRTIGSRPNLSGFILVGDRLIYEAFFFNPEEFTSIFYSVPLADLNKKEPALTEVFKVTQAPERHAPTQSWFPGPNMFVYTDEQHALHARTYDGAIDLVLERGVDFVESDWYYGY